MALSKKEIIDDFNFFKKKAIYYGERKSINKAVCYSEIAARIAYNFNFKYSDDELENSINLIAASILKNNLDFIGIQDKIVFYDSFSSDNTCLTLQYIRAIFSWDCDLLYITPRKKIGQQISKELNQYTKCQILIISEGSFEKKIIKAANCITKFQPYKVFLHFSPWDILGFVLWSQVKTTERFFINLTDHAFWLGKSCIDFSLEFRNYGIHISEKERGISKEKLLYQPYYPIISTSKFKGFPISTKNKVIAFAGSTYYKVYGNNFLLLKMIKEVLDENENLIFLFAGNGNAKPMKEFIKNNHLEDRLLLIGYRNDISEVLRNADIYVNTYPMIGGLMSQYAAKMNKPIIGYSDEKLYSFNDTEDLLGIPNRELLIRKTPQSFIKYFNELINDISIREENISFTRDCVFTEAEFNQSLKATINSKVMHSQKCNVRIDQNHIFETYLDMENNYSKSYSHIIFFTLKIRMLSFKPMNRIEFWFTSLIRKSLTLLRKVMIFKYMYIK